ncbi:hypothetical protein C8C94_0391 [Acidovorax sp. 94]|nr:hypothetical protein C8C94_0391 [Acidovorax sp. 94]
MEVDVLTPNSLAASFRDQVLREAMAVSRAHLMRSGRCPRSSYSDSCR